MQRRRLAIFGGTFDPPHIGHLVTASEVRHAGGFDEVLLVVANDPWQKSSGREVTPAAIRFEMTAAAVDGHDGLAACDVEIRRGGPTFTIDTVGELASAGPTDVTLVLGSDAVAGLPTWHRAEELAALVDVLAVARPGGPEVVAPGGWAVRRVTTPAIDVSSTDIRRRCADGRPIDFLVPDGVRSVIAGRGLYGYGRWTTR